MVSRGFTHTPGGDLASVTRPVAPTLAYSYDARGRLSSATSGAAQIASYAYDWREQRVSASSTEVGSRHYLYAEDGQLLAEHDAQTGALLREYVWLGTMPLAMASGAISTPTYTWITTGNLNEPLLLTNAAGQVTASTTRDPWGNPILLAGGTPLDLGYPGQWKDRATGLFQNWHRDYDPTLGRYIEADPLGLGGGSNLFAYVGGDPVNMIDPMGLEILNLFPFKEPNMRDAAERAFDSLSKPVQDNVYHVYSHGGPRVGCVYTSSGCLTGKQFAEWLSTHGYDRFKPIVLYSCETGSLDNGFAQELSTNTGVPVYAPTELVWYNAEKGITGSAPRFWSPGRFLEAGPRVPWIRGRWRTFYPRP